MMNEIKRPLPLDPTEQRTIDRLVDGELSPAEQRELLGALDTVEGGWRRVALAYVEAATWRAELPTLADDAPQATVASAQPMARPKRSFQVRAATTLAMAASFLLAFGLGLWYRGVQHRSATTAGPALTAGGNLAAAEKSPGAEAAAMPEHIVNTAQRSIAAEKIDGPGAETVAARSLPGKAEIIPARGGSGSFTSAPLMPQSVVDALRRMGHRVEQRRHVVPVRLDDGRTVAMPLEELDVEYQGQKAFQ